MKTQDIRFARQRLGMSLRTLGNEMGISAERMRQIEAHGVPDGSYRDSLLRDLLRNGLPWRIVDGEGTPAAEYRAIEREYFPIPTRHRRLQEGSRSTSILEFVRNNGTTTYSAIREQFALSNNVMSPTLNRLVARGYLLRVHRGVYVAAQVAA